MHLDDEEHVLPDNFSYDESILHPAGNKEKQDSFVDHENQRNIVKDAPASSKTYIPEKDMEFDTEEDAYNFYNAYAASMGFSIRKAAKNKGKPIVYRKFVCSAEGTRHADKRDVYYQSHRPETRTGCGACMVINSRYTVTGKFQVTEFVADHNGHQLVSPRKSHMLRSHRRITSHQAEEIDNLSKSRITPKASLAFVSEKLGGREKVGYILQDLKNYLRSKRTIQMQDGELGALLNYLQLKQSEDPNFFNAFQVDEDNMITNIFWTDDQMMSDYMYFGDVVCFDTTYRKNSENRPFGLFVGVNHHRKTVVFGATFLYDETADTFKWLFGTFEEAMNGKKPETIFTDEDPAMAKALGEVWHGTHHRLCIWHIYQNSAKHIGDVFKKFPDFVNDFKNCIYGYEAEEDFFEAWDEMLSKYEGLRDNEWLQRLFSKKEKWALVYGRQHFCADIISTQRSESMNSVLKRYVDYKTNLLQFFEQFDRLVEDRRYAESEEDARNKRSMVHLSNDFEILKHAREVYTHKSFLVFQAQLSYSYDAKKKEIVRSETNYQYEVTPKNKHYHRTVTYDASDNSIVCSCKKFEFVGILCSHALKIYAEHNVMRIPDFYIKNRWTKSARKGIIGAFSKPAGMSTSSPDNLNGVEEKSRHGDRYRELCRIFSQLTTRASRAADTFELAKAIGYKALEDVDAMFDTKGTTQPTTTTSYVVKSSLVSRVTKKQGVASPDQAVEAGGSMDNSTKIAPETLPEGEAIIRGLKKKQASKVKSGKRFKSGLEEAISKRKPRNKKVQVPKLVENNAQNVDVVNPCLVESSALRTTPRPTMIPFSQVSQNVNVVSSGLVESSALRTTMHPTMIPFSQVSQNNEAFHPYWSSPQLPSFPNHHGVSYLSHPHMKFVNPTIPQQLGYYPQLGNTDHLTNASMENMLQAQMLHGQALGRYPTKVSTSDAKQQLARSEDGSA